MRLHRSATRALLGLGLVTSLAACGGNDTQGSAAALATSISQAVEAGSTLATGLAEPPVAQPGFTTDADPTTAAAAEAVVRQVDKTGWYDGFAITVDQVTAEPGFDTDVDVTVDISYLNLGIENDSPPSASVEADGEVVDDYSDNPDIPGGGKAKGELTFTVRPTAAGTLDDALDVVVLVYGDTSDNQTMIPLAADAEVESQQPMVLELAGNLTQGQIIVDVVGGGVAPSYDSGEKGKALVDVRITLTCAADCNPAGWNTGYEQFSLTGPDGTSVVADDRSDYCCDALYPGTVSDSERNVLTFVVPMPGTGKYTLAYDNPNITSTGVAPATFEFTA